jgi:hypothetical protein
MSSQICPKCGTNNPAEMRFCSNCGQTLSAPIGREEPPPTIFINQPPVSPKQPEFAAPAPQIPVNPPQQPKKSSKAWIFGIAGCLGLGVIALVIGYGSSVTVENNKNTVISKSSPKSNSNSVFNSKPLASDSPETTQNDSDDADSYNYLVTLLEARKKVGNFNQNSAKGLVTKDYFPQGEAAAQAEYSDGSKFVYLTVGSFASMAAAKRNFDDQIAGIKSGGGKVTFQDTAADGTISAVYNNNGFYFAEFCNTNNFCNRIHSDNQAALSRFLNEYAK